MKLSHILSAKVVFILGLITFIEASDSMPNPMSMFGSTKKESKVETTNTNLDQKSTEKTEQKELFKSVFEKVYGGGRDDVAQGVVALENKDAAIVGTCNSFDAKRTDICVTRINRDGDMAWRLMLGGEKEDEGKAISRALDGSIFVLGMTKSLSKEYDKDLYIAKISLDGKLIWEKAIGGNRDEYPGGIIGTDDGGMVAVGSTESYGRGDKNIYIAKLDSNGNLISAKNIGSDAQEEARSVTRMRNGALALVGLREVRNGDYEQFFIMKLDQNGKQIWSKTYGGSDFDALNGVTPTIDDGLVAVGETRSFDSDQTDLTVMKYDTNGNLMWHKIYGFKYYEYGNAVTLMRDGGFLLAGGTNTLGKGGHDMYVLVLDKDGELVWSHAYGKENEDKANGVALLSDGSVLLVGSSDSYTLNYGFYMVKIGEKRRSAR